MPTQIADLYADAIAADRAFDAALKSAGYQSRWAWSIPSGPARLTEAYNAKIAADEALHRAYVAKRDLVKPWL